MQSCIHIPCTVLCSLQEREGRQESNALDVHAQRLGMAAVASHAAVHPLEGVLESFTYQDWQLEAHEPLLPQVSSVSPSQRRSIDVRMDRLSIFWK